MSNSDEHLKQRQEEERRRQEEERRKLEEENRRLREEQQRQQNHIEKVKVADQLMNAQQMMIDQCERKVSW